MSRLPVVGQDEDIWGEILNDFLSVEHNNDGTLKKASTINNAVQSVNGNSGPTVTLTAGNIGAATDSAVVHKAGNETVTGTKTFSTSPIVPDPANSAEAANKNYVDSVVASGAADATTSSKGIVQLAGDLAGTAVSPTVPGLSSKEPTITAGTTAQYYRGDKTWQTLNKSAVGLSNVDNTSDTNKPISTATQTALNGKEPAITVGTSAQYYRGDKTWQTLDKSAVGLSNVDNTSDTNKPVSTATQTALSAKTDKSTLTTKGDIYAATSANTPTRLGVGADGRVLTADSAQTTGLSWTDLSSTYIPSSQKGAANGVAQLDGSGKVTPGQLQTSNITKVLPYSYLGNLSTSVGTFRLYNDTGATWTITGVRASVGTAPTGAAIIIDVNKNGTTIFTTQANRPTIAAAANTSGNVTNPDVTTVSAGEYLTIDIDQVGSTIAGTDLTVQVEVY